MTCVVHGDVHYRTFTGHVHRVLNTNAPVLNTSMRATLCEVSNADHSVTLARALVLNLPSPSPLITYEFLMLHGGGSPETVSLASPVLFCTGTMFRPRELSLKTFSAIMFTCGPGDVLGNRAVCDAHTKTVRMLARVNPYDDDCEGDSGLVIDARFFERLVSRVVPTNSIGVWIESIAFRHYFLTTNVLRAMCYAGELHGALLRGHEQTLQTFMQHVERTSKPMDQMILSRFHLLDDPSKTFNDALSGNVSLSPVAAAVLHRFPRLVLERDTKSSSACPMKHTSVTLQTNEERGFFESYDHLARILDTLELLRKRYESGTVMHVNCADDTHTVAVVQHLQALGCASSSQESVSPSSSGVVWLKLEWPKTPPVLVALESGKAPSESTTVTITRSKFNEKDILTFFSDSVEASARSRRRNANQWKLDDLAERTKNEKNVVACVCLSADGALWLLMASGACRAKHGYDSVVFLNQPSTSGEIKQTFSDLGPRSVVVGCVIYGDARELHANLPRLEEAYTEYCERHRLAPRILKIVN